MAVVWVGWCVCCVGLTSLHASWDERIPKASSAIHLFRTAMQEQGLYGMDDLLTSAERDLLRQQNVSYTQLISMLQLGMPTTLETVVEAVQQPEPLPVEPTPVASAPPTAAAFVARPPVVSRAAETAADELFTDPPIVHGSAAEAILALDKAKDALKNAEPATVADATDATAAADVVTPPADVAVAIGAAAGEGDLAAESVPAASEGLEGDGKVIEDGASSSLPPGMGILPVPKWNHGDMPGPWPLPVTPCSVLHLPIPPPPSCPPPKIPYCQP